MLVKRGHRTATITLYMLSSLSKGFPGDLKIKHEFVRKKSSFSGEFRETDGLISYQSVESNIDCSLIDIGFVMANYGYCCGKKTIMQEKNKKKSSKCPHPYHADHHDHHTWSPRQRWQSPVMPPGKASYSGTRKPSQLPVRTQNHPERSQPAGVLEMHWRMGQYRCEKTDRQYDRNQQVADPEAFR